MRLEPNAVCSPGDRDAGARADGGAGEHFRRGWVHEAGVAQDLCADPASQHHRTAPQADIDGSQYVPLITK
jgi:hypothetical protein